MPVENTTAENPARDTTNDVLAAESAKFAAGSEDQPNRSTPKNRARLFIATAILAIVLIGYNIVIRHTARTSQRQQLLTALSHIPADTDCVFLGNSLVEAGCDVNSFIAAWPQGAQTPKAVNLALGATSPVEHYLVLKEALRQQPLHLKYLIYGFFDDQLNSATAGDWSDLVGNRAFSYYFPDEAARLYAPGSTLKKWQLRVTQDVPMLSERSSLWGKVEKLRRKFEDIGMPPTKSNRFGRVQDFAALEATDVPSFVNRCGNIISKHRGFSAPIHEIIKLGHEHGAQVILLEMPMPSRHRTVFYSLPAWSDLRRHLTELARAENAVYFPASDWVKEDANFEDVTHLNENGAKVFSAQLAKAVAAFAQRGQTEVANLNAQR